MGAILRLAAAGSIVVFVACDRGRNACRLCDREECRIAAFTVYEESGRVERTCCPRCALRYLGERRPLYSRLEVNAFDDAALLDAEKAVFVEGSDAHPCARSIGSTPPQDERGCCLLTVYDRCEPSLVAFSDGRKAAAFAREHGGFVRSWPELVSSAP